jgi:exodeoxyribonuclease V alpha subunit
MQMQLRLARTPPPDPAQRRLAGVYRDTNFFYPSGEGEAGVVIGTLAGGETVKGSVEKRDDLEAGRPYCFYGRWDAHPKYGYQFVFDMFVSHVPHDRDGMVAYLMSTVVGVGKRTAERLWETFGSEAAEILADHPELVTAEKILSSERAKAAAESIRDDAAERDTLIDLYGLFKGRGFRRDLPQRCFTLWGREAATRVRRDPFILMMKSIPTCVFSRLDRLYLDLGHSPRRLKRQALGLWDAASRNRDGHTWLSRDDVSDAVRRVVGEQHWRPAEALALLVRTGWMHELIVAEQAWVATAERSQAERVAGQQLRRLRAGRACWPSLPEGLTPHQAAAISPLLAQPVGILIGTPGTGKTHTAVAVIRQVVVAHGVGSIAVCAPTGRAAVRLTAVMRKAGVALTATTIHRLLGLFFRGETSRRSQFHAGNPLPHRFIVVDETSMLDVDLAARLLDACAAGTNILFVGDPYQLPPVGHGAPLRDMLAGGMPYGELSKIRRNSGAIVRACAAIKAGELFQVYRRFDLAAGENLRFALAKDADEISNTIRQILDAYRARGELNVVDDIQVITASNALRKRLNTELQAHLNPDGAGVKGRIFRNGDKVICLKNQGFFLASSTLEAPKKEYVANGDIGRIRAVAARYLEVEFPSPTRLVRVPMGKPIIDDPDADEGHTGCDLDLAYAVTAHKFQGSETPVVLVVADRSAGMVASQEWWYTALSRAQRACILIGKMSTVVSQCLRSVLWHRKTFLAERISE